MTAGLEFEITRGVPDADEIAAFVVVLGARFDAPANDRLPERRRIGWDLEDAGFRPGGSWHVVRPVVASAPSRARL